MPPFEHFYASFSTNDLKTSKEFYENVLGLSVSETEEGLSIVSQGEEVFIYPKPDHQPATFTVLNFLVPHIEETVAELGMRGVILEHYNSSALKTDESGICWNDGNSPGPRGIAWFKDPAGNILSVIENY